MPPPKRPFTTSSLTSSIKSTIASQPLLQNLTNIDKLSSQASTLAQKTPFFGAINQQFQNHQQQHNNAPIQTTASSSDRQEQQQHQHQHQLQHQSSISASGINNNNINDHQTTNNDNNSNMMRGAGPGQQAMANTPAVDMSHLTEEERLMIQSVMAKAEMADMGLPVDTSVPSSTNLPSTTSQFLAQQTRQHLASQEQQQQQQHQQMRQSAYNQPQQQPQHQQQQQEHYQQQQQQYQQPSMNPQMMNQVHLNQQQQPRNDTQFMQQNQMGNVATSMAGAAGGDMNAIDQANFSRQMQQQQQQPPQSNNMNNQQPFTLQQQQQRQQQEANQPGQNRGAQQQYNSYDTSRGQLPSLEQQTQQLVSQINSQFNLGGGGGGGGGGGQQQQQQQGNQQHQQQAQPSPNQAQLKQAPSMDLTQEQINRMQQQQQVPNINNQSIFGQVPLQQRQQQQENLANFTSQPFDGTTMNQLQPQLSQHQQGPAIRPQQQRQIPDNVQQMANVSQFSSPNLQQLQANNNNNNNNNNNMMMAQAGSYTPNQQDFSNQQQLQQPQTSIMMAPEENQVTPQQLLLLQQQQQQNPLIQQNMMIPQHQQAQVQQMDPMNQVYQQDLMYRNQLQQQPQQSAMTSNALADQQPFAMQAGQDNTAMAAMLVDPTTRQNIRFGPTRQASLAKAAAYDASYEHPLSDQELNYHQASSRRSKGVGGAGREAVRRYDSAEVTDGGPSGRLRSGRRSRNRDDSDQARSRDIQAYDLAQKIPTATSTTAGNLRQKSRVLPQPGGLKQQYQRQQQQQQVSGDRSLQSSLERLHEDHYGSPRGDGTQCLGKQNVKPGQRATTSAGLGKRVVGRHEQKQRKPKEQQQQAATGKRAVKSARYHSTDSEDIDDEPEELDEDVDGDGDEEDDDDDDEEDAENEIVSLDSSNATKSKLSAKDKQQVANNGTKGQTSEDISVLLADKNDKALQLLSELKLTEQANQVMEQQQLLIKQSQELIKLQQAQLEKQTHKDQEVANKNQLETQQKVDDVGDKTKKQQKVSDGDDKEETLGNNNNINDSEQHKERPSDEIGQSERARSSKDVDDDNNDDDDFDERKSIGERREVKEKEKEKDKRKNLLGSTKSTSFSYDAQNSADESEDTTLASRRPKSGSKPTPTLQDNETESPSEGRRDTNNSNKNIRPSSGIKKSTHLASTQTPSSAPSPRYNRDLLQSPTDTTDSDADLISSSHSAIQRRPARHALSKQHQQPPQRGYIRRREPTGLPPSPLPVAAAIQLHHMQQQHLKHQQLANGRPSGQQQQPLNQISNFSRANFLRSRSVTNSPNHLLERANSGYMTDSQPHRMVGGGGGGGRPSSPETLSEYGGQRRHQRKRLPVPPQNAVPITPSMVRKMVQAQKAAPASCSSKLLNSVNAQSTQLTNMHSIRNPSLDRPLQADHHDPQYQRSRSQASIDHPPLAGGRSMFANNNPTMNRFRSIESQPTTGSSILRSHEAASNNPDLNKFLSSTYGNSILKNSPQHQHQHQHQHQQQQQQHHHNISDVKETPELDKLISNLDGYYGLDGSSRNNRQQQIQQQTRFAPQSSVHSSSLLGGSQNDQFGRSQLGSGFMSSSSPSRHMTTATPTTTTANAGAPSTSSLLQFSRYPQHPQLGLSYRRNSDGEFGLLGSSLTSTRTPGMSNSGRSNLLYGLQSGYFNNHEDDSISRSLAGLGLPASSGRYQAIDPRGPYSSMATVGMSASTGQQQQSALRQQYPSISRDQQFPSLAAGSMSNQLQDNTPLSRASPYYERHLGAGNYNRRLVQQFSSRYPATGSFDGANPALISPYRSFDHHPTLADHSTTTNNNSAKYRLSQGQQQPALASSLMDQRLNTTGGSYLNHLDSTSYAGGGGGTTTTTTAAAASTAYPLGRLEPLGSGYQPASDYAHRGRPQSQIGLSRPNFRDLQYGSIDLDTRGSNAPAGGLASNSFDSRPSPMASSGRYFSQLDQNPSTGGRSGQSSYDSQYGQYNDLSRPSGPNPASGFAPFTKDDIIRNGPKFNSIGYRFRTENQNKYVAESRAPIDCLQTKYPHPYKRILLSKNPKDRIGNGIGVRITGGQAMPNLYDKVNRCIVGSGAFVTEVFQSSNVYLMDELHEGDQIIEWNGVNLCNRSDEEVQQILLSQFSDDEVDIVYLNRDRFHEVYGRTSELEVEPTAITAAAAPTTTTMDEHHHYGREQQQQLQAEQQYKTHAPDDPFETFSNLHKPNQTYHPHGGSRYANEPSSSKASLRRKLSLSSISHMWSR